MKAALLRDLPNAGIPGPRRKGKKTRGPLRVCLDKTRSLKGIPRLRGVFLVFCYCCLVDFSGFFYDFLGWVSYLVPQFPTTTKSLYTTFLGSSWSF